ncbi:MAG: hypothetical protein V4760_15020 [Bdellovibrionota bacterium]
MPTLPDSSELLPVLWFTFGQAFVSAGLAVVLGFLGALGLQWVGVRLGPRSSRTAEVMSLLPNVAPVLVFILAMFRFAPSLKGFAGVVVAHALLNVGLVSVALTRAIQDKLSGMADLAWIEGAGRIRFLRRVAIPLLRGEILALFLFVFAICFASFAVPMMIGGTRGTTIETLIWQKIRLGGDWSSAIGLSILQFAFLMALAFLLGREPATPIAGARSGQRILSWAGGVPFLLAPTVFILLTLLENPFAGLSQLGAGSAHSFSELVADKLVASFFVSFLSGSLIVGLLMTIAYLDPRGVTRRLLLGAVAPSAVITGFAILFLWRETGTATLIKISIGLALVATPAFYRLRWDGVLSSLRGQRSIAETLGASRSLIFRKIVWPQTIGAACFVAGLASLWAWGDFALSRVVAEGDVTLALIVQSLMESYRLELALTLVWILILGSAVTFFIFEGAGRVLGSKSQT